MAVDLGGVYQVAVDVRDAAGNLTDPASVSLTITLPNGTEETPSVSVPLDETGKIRHDFETTVVGRHVVRVTTDDPDTAWTDVFHVRPDVGEIISLAAAKGQLDDASSADDEEIRDFLAAVTFVCEFFVGEVIRRQHTEVHDGGETSIVLRRPPVIQVDSVTEDGETLDSDDWSLRDRVLTRVTDSSAATWKGGIDGVTVVYTAGQQAVDSNVLLAGRLLLQHWWATMRQGANMPRLAADDVLTIPGVAWSIPIRVKQLLDATRRA